MESNLSKLAIGGAATATTASVGAPVYYLVNQQKEQANVSTHGAKEQKPIKVSPYREKFSKEERDRKIDALSAGDVTGDGSLADVKEFLEEYSGCEILVKKNGETKAFYEWNKEDLMGLGDEVLTGKRTKISSLCSKGIDPLFLSINDPADESNKTYPKFLNEDQV